MPTSQATAATVTKGPPPRYIFTVSTGRCGQNTLADLLRDHLPEATVAFEEPQVTPVLPGALGTLERRFRRSFVETHELLGRGRVLTAFARADSASLDRFGRDRIAWIERRMAESGARVYIDVSKHFIHGFHIPLSERLTDFGMIRLTRDPVSNMRSYLNRRKSFELDNNPPDSDQNCLRLAPGDLSYGELYLWIWFETQLRFEALKARYPAIKTVDLTTPELNDAAAIARLMDTFHLAHGPVRVGSPKNTNKALGFGETAVTREDVESYERFVARVPQELISRIPYLRGYDVRRAHPSAEPAG